MGGTRSLQSINGVLFWHTPLGFKEARTLLPTLDWNATFISLDGASYGVVSTHPSVAVLGVGTISDSQSI